VLRLEGEVRTALTAEPQAMTFGMVVEDSRGEERRVKLTAAPGERVGVLLPPEVPGRQIHARLDTKVPGKEYELVLTMAPPFTPGPVNESILLTLDHPRQKSLEVRASATVAPRLSLEPSVLRMFDALPGQPVRTQARFENRGARPVRVTEAKASVPQVKVLVAEIAPGRSYDLRLEVPSDFVPPAQGTPIEIRTDDPERPLFTLSLLPKAVPPSSPTQLVGKPAPSFSLQSLAGRTFTNATATKQVTLLDFFAADCPHCKRQIPRLATALKPYAGQPVHLILVAQKMRGEFSADQVRAVLKSSGVEPEALDVVVDMSNVPGKSFLVESYPALVILGRDGKVGAAVIGNSDDLEARVKSSVDSLLSGKPIPVVAVPKDKALREAAPGVRSPKPVARPFNPAAKD